MSNTITAYFKGRVGVAESVYQNDYGIIMAFDSIDLPAHFACYFSRLNQEEALPGLGADNRVTIPNSILANPGNVTIHIPLHTGEDDSEVEYVSYFKVIGRARPIDDGTPAQMTAIERALALLSQPITNIEEIVNEALSFTGDTFAEMQEQLNTWKGGVESDFDNLEAQFDTAVAAVTTDTEVTNIRVGDDNVTYTTAGEAVRNQFSNVKGAISELAITVDKDSAFTINGYIFNNVIQTDNGWRCSQILPLPIGATRIQFNLYGFYLSNTHVQNITFYDENGDYISYVGCPTGANFQRNFESTAIIPSNAHYYRLCTKYSELSTNYIKVITALAEEKKSANGYYESLGDTSDFTINGYILNNAVVSDNGWRTTDFIPLSFGASKVHFRLFGFYYGGSHVQNVTFYNNLKQPLGYVGCSTETSNFQKMFGASADIPSEARYYRLATKYSNIAETVFSIEYASANGKIDQIRKKRIYSLQDAYLSWMNGEKFPIAFAGDSTTDGYGTTGHVDNVLGTDHVDTKAYPYLLQAKLREECNNNTLRIYNAGFSGKKIGYVIENFEAEFGSGTPYEDTKMIGISFGINDRVDTIAEYGTFVKDLTTLANLCFDKGIQPFMLTCQCTCESANGVDPNRSEWENMAYANKAKYEVAKLLDLEILDVSKATAHFIEYSNKPLLQIMHDLCHFGDGGHEFESGFFFSEIVPRTIFVDGEMNIGFTTQGIKSDVVFADGNNTRLSILSSVQNGFKAKVASVTGIFTGDIVLLDAWVFIDGKKPLTLTSYCDNVNTTHVLIDGVNTALTAKTQTLGTLDLGLHHIVAKSGSSNTVEFYGFRLTE